MNGVRRAKGKNWKRLKGVKQRAMSLRHAYVLICFDIKIPRSIIFPQIGDMYEVKPNQ